MAASVSSGARICVVDVPERAIVGIEIGADQYIAGFMAFGQLADGGPGGGGHLAHAVVLVNVRADQDGVFIKHLDDENLVVMAVIGRNAGEAPLLRLRIPFVDVVLEVGYLRRQQFVRIQTQILLQLGEAL